MTQQPTKKYPIAKIVFFITMIALAIVAFVLHDHIFGENSVFNQVVSQSTVLQTLYQKIPALIRSVQIIAVAMALAYLLRLFTTKSLAKSKRGVTISKLINSFVKWIIIIVTVLFVLDAWGVDTTAIIASAGILSLVVGLGAQSLVADIIAGLFIVIEGEYQVGDIVVIDDWRGTVTEIGIRTTKVEDAGGNVKIVNNSEITTLINQTQALSVAKVTMSIEYDESLPKVELVIRDNLDKIKERIPGVINGPFYKGVTALSASSVDLLFLANCEEENIYQVQRDLLRELKLLFDENKINIPFQQIVVHQPIITQTRTSKKVKEGAQDFVDEQKTLSRTIEEKPDQD